MGDFKLRLQLKGFGGKSNQNDFSYGQNATCLINRCKQPGLMEL